MKFGSLFSGISGFDLGFEQAGLECAWQCEIDKAARSVLATHWPGVPCYEDIRDVGRRNTPAVDLICGGFPCQDLSVAGKRAGLAGERSGLWFEFERVIRELLPMWVVIENVPGLLSSNGGIDIQMIIDTLTQIGYTVDVDIKDAQEFGVAQRRRRVFLTCVRLDGLLKQRTPLSRQISADLLAQTLLNIWGAIPPASSLVPLRSVYDKPSERCGVLLSKMMSLFEITLERLAYKPSQNIWDVLLDQFGDEEKSSASGLIASAELPAPQSPGKVMCESLLKRITAGNGDLSISTLLSSALADGCKLASKSITSTWTQETTDQAIFTFAVACLNTIARMIPSLDWSASCWSVAQSALMLLQENMNYARQTSNQLFIGPGLRDSWWDYLCAASHIESELERRIGNIRAAEVLFERDGVFGHPPARGAQGQGVAGTIAAGAHANGYNGRDVDSGNVVIAKPLGNHHRRDDLDNDTFIVNEPQTFDWQAGVASGKDRVEIMDPPGRTRSLSASRSLAVHSIAFQSSQSGVRQVEQHATLDGNNGSRRQNGVIQSSGVRRLTPTECERLQGFPDGWTDGQSDSARYRQLGNAVAVPVARWIGERIMRNA